jgi:patatin-related protein
VEDSKYKPSSEVRFAIVMYGGVSLAIYINGVAQELFRLVRATAPNQERSDLAVGDADLRPIERVYREIGRRRVGDTFWDSRHDEDLITGVETRFVVDILSGTSAGGINGILLAKALANGLGNIDALKDLWIEEGDIADLLNAKAAYEGIPPFAYKKPPASLLAGDRLYARALSAIEGMTEQIETSAPDYADQVDLAVTMTDLQGVWLPIRLADGTVSEPRHRASLRFSYGSGLNQFSGVFDRMLAFAARATSSFPFAFAPITLDDFDADPSDDERRLFNDWIQVGASFGGFAFADGGYLYNKPFSHATRALARRRADLPVTRKLLYVEPDPAVVPRDRNVPRGRPDALVNAGLALVGLPSAQPIRDDLSDIEERNAALERIEEVTRAQLIELVRPGEAPPMAGPSASVYLRLRRASVTNALTEILERAASLRPGGDWSALAKRLLQIYAGESDAAIPSFLAPLDVDFRFRRLSYLEGILDQLAAGGRPAQELITASGQEVFNAGNVQEQIAAAKRLIDDRRAILADADRAIRLRGVDDSTVLQPAAELANACHTHLESVTQASNPDLDVPEIYARPEVANAVEGFVAAVAAGLADAFAAVDQLDFAQAAVDGGMIQPLAQILNVAFDQAEHLDQAIYPLRWPSLGEARKVDVHRVSPRDASSLVPMPDIGDDGKPTGPLRLAGVSLGHFGGFLDQRWRRNDMLWGRLDGAERLIAVLVPDERAQEELRVQAHAAILREEFDDEVRAELIDLIEPAKQESFEGLLEGSDDRALVDAFAAGYVGPAKLEVAKASRLAARSMSVGGRVLGGLRQGEITGKLLRPFALALRGIGGLASGALGLVERVKHLFKGH